LLGSVFSFFSGPSVSISRNTNSPSGIIKPGRGQILAVFDVKPQQVTNLSFLTKLDFHVPIEGDQTNLKIVNFSLIYQVCQPRGDIYGYGYLYGYGSVFCQNYAAAP